MIAGLLWFTLARIGIGPVAIGPVAPADTGAVLYPQLAPAAVLARYAMALKLKEPRVISFDYAFEQTGTRTVSETHRVFRSGNDERDEILVRNGKPVNPPRVQIFRGRRNRYTVSRLAPRQADYTFAFIGTFKDGHHSDYVFRLTPKSVRPFAVTDLTIDGVRFLPIAIGFATGLHDGAGTIAFGSNARWWVPYIATARATVATEIASEKLTFFTYRFPPTLPASTFSQRRPPHAAEPLAPGPLAPASRLPATAPASRLPATAPASRLPATAPASRLPATAPALLKL